MFIYIFIFIYICGDMYIYISIQGLKDLQGFRVALLSGEHLKHQVVGARVPRD